MIAEALLKNAYNDPGPEGFSEETRTIAINRALRTFLIAEAAGGKIYPKDYTMGIRVFGSRSDPIDIFEKAQGYRTEYLEDAMEREIQSLQASGYDYFKPITNEEKEALFKQVKTEIDSTASSEALEKIKYKYGNFIEIVDLVNDAHIRIDK